MKKEGRTQQRIKLMLSALGYSEIRLYPATGFWRSDSRADCCRWTASARDGNKTVQLQSWFTMTEIVRSKGLTVEDDGDVVPAGMPPQKYLT